jgi:hypothetical protein
LEVLIARYQSIALFVFKANSIAIVQAVKILYSGDDGIGSIVRVYVHSHGEAGTLLRSFCEEILKDDMFRRKDRRRSEGGWGWGNIYASVSIVIP